MTFVSTAVLKIFRRRLTNLSSRNRSLLLTTLPNGQFLDLHDTDYLLNKSSFTIIADLICRKSSISLCEVLDARQERSNAISRKLRRINRTARFIEQERGTEDLYVGWPFVRGKFLDDTIVNGPLLFFPVQIDQQGKFWKLTRRGDELAFLNPTLALAYGQFNQIKIPDEFIEKNVDEFDRDPLIFRTQLYEWLKTSPFEINFNPDLFFDKLQIFNKHTAKDLNQLERTGELKLYPEAVLGIFPQAGSFLVPDYDALIEKEKKRADAQKGEDEKTEDYWVDKPSFLPVTFPDIHSIAFLPEKNIHTPLLMDASQEAAVRAVKAGQSLVVQGPPGTGKSQLIANIMADAAATGKRVLLVCQKRAALDVVQERLRGVGMESFLALIHDFQNDRRALYAQIAGQIEKIDTYRQQNNSLNTVLLERDFDVESRRIDDTVSELQTIKNALFDTSECGISAKELYLILPCAGSNYQTIVIDDVYQHFPLTNVDNFTRRLAAFAAYQQRVGTQHLWANRVSFASFVNDDLSKVNQLISGWNELRQVAVEQTNALLGRPLLFPELLDLQKHDWDITTLLTLLDAPNSLILWPLVNQLRHIPTHPALIIDEIRLGQLIDLWEEARANPGPETSLPTTELRAFRDLLSTALKSRSSWINWTWWQLTNSGKVQLRSVATANDLTLSKLDLQKLATKISQRIRLESIRHEIQPLLAGLSLPESPDSIRLLRHAQPIVERLRTSQPLSQLPASAWQTAKGFSEIVTALLTLSALIIKQWDSSQAYLTTYQLNQIWDNEGYGDTLSRALRQDFDLLVDADRLQASFSEPERVIVDRLVNVEATKWTEIFLNSLRTAWLNHIEKQFPELRSVSSLKMIQLEQTLQESIQHKQRLSRDILLVKLREQTYRNLSFNRLNNVVTYRDLLHQTTKKRNVWPVRKLMDASADEVFKLVPCWLASPESVSAMFPLQEGLFDLVIFDEASQCFAENGVPAIARGKQVIITGDNQQLRPSDLYHVRLDETELDEMPAALEVESLLELAVQQLPQMSLTEHYRSRSLDLITFSNEHFYQNRLSLLPHFDDINQHEPAIRYLNVKGTWHQNANISEAEAILELLDQLVIELPGRSIGIVTFNYPQQQLIQDLLESKMISQRTDEMTLSATTHDDISSIPPLFVKNIENVQGDERDIIIFSVGYAPNEHGRLSMQFGSLNAKGGGNRLNVAVTRARERVYIVTSLWPEQLLVDEAINEGPKLLKAYLAYALDVDRKQFQPIPNPSSIMPFGTLLKDRLAINHPNWKSELPFADITVKAADNTYESLVLTDDDAYYQQTPKQAHAYLPISLQVRNWTFLRVWSREFWRKGNA